MLETFIYVTLTTIAVGVLWAAYELYQIREALRYVRVKDITDRLIRQAKESPQLFDQEQP